MRKSLQLLLVAFASFSMSLLAGQAQEAPKQSLKKEDCQKICERATDVLNEQDKKHFNQCMANKLCPAKRLPRMQPKIGG